MGRSKARVRRKNHTGMIGEWGEGRERMREKRPRDNSGAASHTHQNEQHSQPRHTGKRDRLLRQRQSLITPNCCSSVIVGHRTSTCGPVLFKIVPGRNLRGKERRDCLRRSHYYFYPEQLLTDWQHRTLHNPPHRLRRFSKPVRLLHDEVNPKNLMARFRKPLRF